MIATFLITAVIEAAIVAGYSLRRRKPVLPLLLTSILGNVVTQPMLWAVLMLASRNYLTGLWIAEILVWAVETLFLHAIPANQLKLREAAVLSLGMNVTSLMLGWFLPV